MHKRVLSKPDGRPLILYGCRPIPANLAAPSPSSDRARPTRTCDGIRCAASGSPTRAIARTARSCRRPNTTRSRRRRSGESDRGAGRRVGRRRLREPVSDADAWQPTTRRRCRCRRSRRTGVCEVVVFTQDPASSLGRAPALASRAARRRLGRSLRGARRAAGGRVRLSVRKSRRGSRCHAASPARSDLRVSVRTADPGARARTAARVTCERHGRGLLEDIVARELVDGVRMLYAGPEVAAFMPICARYSYEVWIAPQRPAPSFAALTATNVVTSPARSRPCC